MKNFYDLLDTRADNLLVMDLRPIAENGNPYLWASINGRMIFQDWLCSPVILQHTFGPRDVLKVEIGLKHKQYSASRETAIVIDRFAINEFELVPGWTQLSTYHNERGVTAPTNYLGFNGTWCLETDRPFYQWWHQQTGQGWLLEPKIKVLG